MKASPAQKSVSRIFGCTFSVNAHGPREHVVKMNGQIQSLQVTSARSAATVCMAESISMPLPLTRYTGLSPTFAATTRLGSKIQRGNR